jgi:predicted nucleic acid-binding protein
MLGEYFSGSEKGKRVRDIVESDKNEIFISIITIAEVVSFVKINKSNLEEVYGRLMNLAKIYNMDAQFTKECGILHADIRIKIKDFGMADCFVLLTARRLKARIITGDPHFKGFKDVLFLS